VARVTRDECQAWLERTKLTIDTLDSNLLEHLEEEVLDRIAGTLDVSTWTDQVTTPKLIRTIIARCSPGCFYSPSTGKTLKPRNLTPRCLTIKARC